MKLGIKCEIHECTIEVAKFLESEGVIPLGYSKTLNEDKKLRIDNQYYLINREVIVNYNQVLEFVLNIKDISNKLTIDRIKDIRKKLVS